MAGPKGNRVPDWPEVPGRKQEIKYCIGSMLHSWCFTRSSVDTKCEQLAVSLYWCSCWKHKQHAPLMHHFLEAHTTHWNSRQEEAMSWREEQLTHWQCSTQTKTKSPCSLVISNVSAGQVTRNRYLHIFRQSFMLQKLKLTPPMLVNLL